MTADEKKDKVTERKALREAQILNAITGPRAGTGGYMAKGGASLLVMPAASKSLAGVELGALADRPTNWLKPDPENIEFETLKDLQPGYWQNLTRDIEKAGIQTPLVAMSDGSLVQGHSRLKVALALGIAKVPVLLVLSPLSHEDIRTRRRMDNLLRFEVDEDTRLSMFAEVWPEFYTRAGGVGGRPEKPGHGDQVMTTSEIAARTGKSEKQTRRDRSLATEATVLAQRAGKDRPDVSDFKAARERKNAERREITADQRPKEETRSKDRTPEVCAANGLRELYRNGSLDYRKGVEQTLVALEVEHLISRESYEAIRVLTTQSTPSLSLAESSPIEPTEPTNQ